MTDKPEDSSQGAARAVAEDVEVQASSTSLKTQLFRFSSVGGCTAALDYRRTQHLTALGLHRSAAKALGWVAGTIAAYIANARWTFGAQVSGRTAGAVAALYGSTFVVQNFLYWVLNAPLLSLGLDGVVKDTVAFVIAQAVATVTNFVIQRIFIFKDK
ncbi:MAG: GtrA family protein [Corynebacterium flavescens]|nr:GtrA family protein [Corynebacterium flavescens]MDN6235703.1 GtrA family protein [Corynebacterium flavescens]